MSSDSDTPAAEARLPGRPPGPPAGPLRALLLAPPGAGKGTQAVRISERFGVPHISTGDLFRRHVADETALGRSVAGFLAHGDLVPDDVVLSIVRSAVADAMTRTGGYLLDGFPRTVAQARAGAHLAHQLGAEVRAVLHLDVGEDELLRRLLQRAQVENRPDDDEPTIRHRLDVYRTATAPLLAYYRDRGVLISIDGHLPVDAVTSLAFDALDRVVAAPG